MLVVVHFSYLHFVSAFSDDDEGRIDLLDTPSRRNDYLRCGGVSKMYTISTEYTLPFCLLKFLLTMRGMEERCSDRQI